MLENCLKYIRYDSPHSIADFGFDFPLDEYINSHGLNANRKELSFDIDSIEDGSVVFVKIDLVDKFIHILPQLIRRG